MTSIHASIPLSLLEATSAARGRGGGSQNHIPMKGNKSPDLKSRPQDVAISVAQRLTKHHDPTSPILGADCLDEGSRESEKVRGMDSLSKENNSSLAPTSNAAHNSRRPLRTKRPLTDLMGPGEDDLTEGNSYLSSSDGNVAITKASISDALICMNLPAEDARVHKLVSRTAESSSVEQRATPALEARDYGGVQATKRLCSEEKQKREQAAMDYPGDDIGIARKSLLIGPSTTSLARSRVSSAPVAVKDAKSGRPRAGLRRL